MIYTVNCCSAMSTYKKFLIQQQTYNGTTYTNVGDVIDTHATFGVVCQSLPFKYLPEPKELAKRDWHDEHGDDVYVPVDGIKFKAYDVEATFLYVGNEETMASNLKQFVDFLYGRINIVSGSIVSTVNATKNVLLKIYDEYTRTGRRGAYVVSHDNSLYFFNEVSADAIAQFKIKFHVCDPVTEINYQNGALV